LNRCLKLLPEPLRTKGVAPVFKCL